MTSFLKIKLEERALQNTKRGEKHKIVSMKYTKKDKEIIK